MIAAVCVLIASSTTADVKLERRVDVEAADDTGD